MLWWLGVSVLFLFFDLLVWEWVWVECLFDFCYCLEIYMLKEKCVYGYYVLLFLYNGCLVGCVDFCVEWVWECLVVYVLYVEVNGMDDVVLYELVE